LLLFSLADSTGPHLYPLEMRMRVLAFPCSLALVFSFLFFHPQLLAGQIEQSQRDAQAIQIVETMLAALGGRSSLEGVRDSIVSGKIEAGSNGPFRDGAFVWRNSGNSFLYENPGRDGKSLYAFNAANRTSSTAIPPHVRATLFPPHLPGLVLANRLNDSRYTFRFIGTTALSGRTVSVIELFRGNDELTRNLTRQVWRIDTSTHLPTSVEYSVSSGNDASAITIGSFVFGDYSKVSGIVLPFEIVIHLRGERVSTARVESAHINTGITPSEFDVPGVNR
jgi:hypothetical protein